MAMREVVDDHGRTWTVFAVIPDSYDDRIGIAEGYSRGWLCYQSTGEKWRLLGIPNGWDQFDDVTIVELMSEAIPAVARDLWGRRV